ncbi:MAG: Spo0E family sporulation regulatory protein-aspartic acid phosphatase [Cellulosilyticaceae bacterium]
MKDSMAKIVYLQTLINKLAEKSDCLTDLRPELYDLSVQLDQLINEYYKEIKQTAL